MKQYFLASSIVGTVLGCGDIGSVRVSVKFQDAPTEVRTQALLFVIRDVPMEGLGCDALWSTETTGLAETSSILDYPNRNDMVAAPVKLEMYKALTILVYAHASKEGLDDRKRAVESALAAGCVDVAIRSDESQEIEVVVSPRPQS